MRNSCTTLTSCEIQLRIYGGESTTSFGNPFCELEVLVCGTQIVWEEDPDSNGRLSKQRCLTLN